ncbi:MAG: hypothetical protein ABIF12_00500 [bacterium]
MNNFLFILVLVFSFFSCGNLIANDPAGSDGVIKIIYLINDAQKVLEQGDPIAIRQAAKDIMLKLKYVDFSQITEFHLIQLSNLIVKNITSPRKEVQNGVLIFVKTFQENASQYLMLFLTNTAMQNVVMNFANQMIQKLPELMTKNKEGISTLIQIFKGLGSK